MKIDGGTFIVNAKDESEEELDFDLDEDLKECQAVIVSPTLELARQIYKMAQHIASFSPKSIVIKAFYGGTDMQREMEKAQKDLQAKDFEIVSAGGGIKVIITGGKVVKSIEIDEDIIDPEEKEMLQDMIVVAINEAITLVNKEEQKILAKQQANMRMPF